MSKPKRIVNYEQFSDQQLASIALTLVYIMLGPRAVSALKNEILEVLKDGDP